MPSTAENDVAQVRHKIPRRRELTSNVELGSSPDSAPSVAAQFGWVDGVLLRCLSHILCVMLFLRLGFVVGEAGIVVAWCTILLSSLATILTTHSLTALVSNTMGDIQGGVYYTVSRSLGPEFGGLIGVLFSIANSVAAALYVVGLAEAIRDLLLDANDIEIIDGYLNDIRFIAILTCTILMAVVYLSQSSTRVEARILIILTFPIFIAFLSYVIGSFFPAPMERKLQGFTGYNWNTFVSNLMPIFSNEHGFFVMLSIYFPAATGILAGANIVGQLRNPAESIPRGTMWAIVISTAVYLITITIDGATSLRYSDGVSPPVPLNNSAGWAIPACSKTEEGCRYGLINFRHQELETMSAWSSLFWVGLLCSALGSALATLEAAPKVFQDVCRDGLFPYAAFFAKGWGKNDAPRRAYAVTFAIAVVVSLIGEINVIAPLVSNFYLATYGLLNFAVYDAAFHKSPAFRPSSPHFSMWFSLAGALLCVVMMFGANWLYALFTCVAMAALLVYIRIMRPEVNWGSETHTMYRNALNSMLRLQNLVEDGEHYRPQVLVLTGNPAARPALVDFAHNVTKGSSLLVCGYVLPYKPCDRVYSMVERIDEQMCAWLRERGVRAFCATVADPSLREGTRTLLQTSGLGRLRPNILMMGFKTNWDENGLANLPIINEFYGTVQSALEMHVSLAVLRNCNRGLDMTELMGGDETEREEEDIRPSDSASQKKASTEVWRPLDDIDEQSQQTMNKNHLETVHYRDYMRKSSTMQAASIRLFKQAQAQHERKSTMAPKQLLKSISNKVKGTGNSTSELGLGGLGMNSEYSQENRRKFEVTKKGSVPHDREAEKNRQILVNLYQFRERIRRGTIDVWWLADDGGLTLLLPYLLKLPKSYLEGARIRVFTLCNSLNQQIDQAQKNMATLLRRFRIDAADLELITDGGAAPAPETLRLFDQLISPFLVAADDWQEGSVTEDRLQELREQTERHLRRAEIIHKYSKDADLVVCTMPLPARHSRTSCPSSVYLAWLDLLTRALPPTLLVRGNGTSVLRFFD